MKRTWIAIVLTLLLSLSGCTQNENGQPLDDSGQSSLLGDGNVSFGESLESLGAYDGYFEGDAQSVTVTCLSGTPDAFRWEGTSLLFTAVDADSVYAISGTLRGNIVLDTGNDFRFDLELHGLSLVSDSQSPITVLSGDEVSIKAKKDTKSYLYDLRPAVDGADSTLHAGAIHSEVDLELGGKGNLTVVSENNNGIHTKDDLQIKNLTLLVACVDNALKGNDSVEIESGCTTLISTGGDCIKTSNSNVSEKGNQRGSVTVTGGTHTLYAARDGIDAAYNVCLEGAEPVLQIYTAKYSNYTKEEAGTTEESDTASSQGALPDGTMPPDAFGGMGGMERPGMGGMERPGMGGMERPGMGGMERPDMGGMERPGMGGMERPGMGGMDGGNTATSTVSAKGIKAANEIQIRSGSITVKSYDDAIHAGGDAVLENGESPSGAVTVEGGTLALYTDDDGIHADGTLSALAGTVSILNSYEGLEGNTVSISGGELLVNARDDGVNSTATEGSGVTVAGGVLTVFCAGDGIDSNSRTADRGIEFCGGRGVILSTSGGNSAIDTENGYTYTAGEFLAIMPRGGMSNEILNCRDLSSVGASLPLALTAGESLSVGIGESVVTVKLPTSMSALIVVLGDTEPSVALDTDQAPPLNEYGVVWN